MILRIKLLYLQTGKYWKKVFANFLRSNKFTASHVQNISTKIIFLALNIFLKREEKIAISSNILVCLHNVLSNGYG